MSRELRISLTAERELDAAYYWYAEHANLATAARFYALGLAASANRRHRGRLTYGHER